ncbi:MAG: hypothetical protein KF788_00065 [Piscinibacter sp.]|nr:hypothetical protein [Piscinibacter sp.]
MATLLLDNAAPGDALAPEDLQHAFDWLTDLARSLDPLVEQAPDVATAQAIARVQENLRQRARALVERQIDLIAGAARVTATHIDAAVAFADETLRRVTEVRRKLEKIRKVLDFFGAVLTGDGNRIVDAAAKLKQQLAQG